MCDRQSLGIVLGRTESYEYRRKTKRALSSLTVYNEIGAARALQDMARSCNCPISTRVRNQASNIHLRLRKLYDYCCTREEGQHYAIHERR